MPAAGQQVVKAKLDEQIAAGSWRQAKATLEELIKRWTAQDEAKRQQAASDATDAVCLDANVGASGGVLTADDINKLRLYLERQQPVVN